VAQEGLARLAKLGIDLWKIAKRLLADGITAFTHALDELLASLEENIRSA
jgi:transaldolase